VPNRELRVVGADSAGANHNCIDKGPQAMQVRDPFRAIDVTGMARQCSDAPIERLSNLADDNWPAR